MRIETDDYITKKTAAKLIGVSDTAITKHVRSGRLQTVEIDGVLFINRDSLWALDQQNREMREKRRAKSKPGRKPS